MTGEKPTTYHEKLTAVQQSLKAPKDQVNEFAGFVYRSADEILGLVKPLLKEHGLVIHLSDSIEIIGDRYYVHAKAMITDGTDNTTASGWAREAAAKKGMDEAQVTGSASSYARKYALCGLFAIDDASQDPDGQKPVDKSKEKVSAAMAQEIERLLKETNSDRDKFFKHFKVKRIMEMNLEQFDKAVGLLTAKKGVNKDES